MNQMLRFRPELSLLLLLIALAGNTGCQDQSSEGCTYGQDCSHYPRDFVVGAPTSDGEPNVFGISWASDGLFSTAEKVDIYTSKSDAKRDGYKDLWGPSAIAYQDHPGQEGLGYFYVTGALENSLAVLHSGFFEGYNCKISQDCDSALHTQNYESALTETTPNSKIYRRDDFGHSFEVPLQSLLSHPADVVTWTNGDNILVFVASRDGGQVSIFEHTLSADGSDTEISLRYLDAIDVESPRRLVVLDRATDDNQLQLVVHGTSEVRSCPDTVKLAEGKIPLDELREDFLSVHTISYSTGSVTLETSTQLRSGSCYGADNCISTEAIRGTWGLIADGTDTLLLSNRCNNEVLEYAVSIPSADDGSEDNTSVTLTASNVYSVMPNGVDTQAALFENCETKPDNLGFKGLTADDDYVYVASWETGYILEWSRDGSALDTPRAVCALEATRCQLNKCTEVNPNWYLRNDPNAHFYQDGSSQQDAMRPFPYQLQIANSTLHMTLDRNSEVATCALDAGAEKEGESTDEATSSGETADTKVVDANLGLEAAIGVQQCEALQWRDE